MSKNIQDAALNIVKKRNRPIEEDSKPAPSRYYKEFYTIDSGEPLSLDTISRRVRKRFAEIDKNSALAMIDLWFIHTHWTTFYSREDSFSKYVKDTLKISRTTAYAILNSIDLLNHYFQSKNKEMIEALNELTATIEDVGVTKLSILAKYKDEEEKYQTLEKLLQGDNITVDSLLQKSKPIEKNSTQTKMDGDDVQVEDMTILSFQVKDKALRKTVIKAIEKYYRRSE